MAELFGYQAGRRMADLDNATLKRAALEDRKTELEIRSAETSLKQNEAFLAAISQGDLEGKVAGPEDVPDVLTNLGLKAAKVGLIEKGKELITAGSTVANQASLVERRQAKTRYEQMQQLDNLYQGVKDQSSWDKANATFQLMTGKPSPYANQPFSPEVLQQVHSATTTAKDKAGVALSEARKALVDAQVETETNRRELIEAQTENNKQRTANLRKTGAKPVPSQYVSAVTNKLKDEFEDAGDRNLSAVALPLAEQVYARIQEEGLSLSQAVNAVVEEATAAGDLGGLAPLSAMMSGAHRDKPLALPTLKDGKVDQTKLKKNMYYVVPGTGQVVLYTKAGKLLVIEPDAPDEEEDLGDADWEEEEE